MILAHLFRQVTLIKRWVLLGVMLFAHMVYGQVNEYKANMSLDDLSINQWLASDGLTSNNITSVYQDSQGLLWITSFNGVMIYDGERFEVYDKNRVSVIDTDGFHCVIEHPDGRMLLGSQGSGIIAYQNGKWSRLVTEGENVAKSVRDLMIASNQDIYAGTDNFGLFRIREGKSIPVLPEQLSNVTVKTIFESKDGTIWISTEGKGVYGITATDTLHFTIANGLKSNTVNALTGDQKGNVLIGSNAGLYKYTPKEGLKSIDELSGIYVNCLFVDESNSVWVGSEMGIFRYNEDLGSIQRINSKKGIDLVRISSLIADYENNIWASSNRSGLIRFKESLATNIIRPSISSDRIYTVHESWNGKIYIGTDQSQIDVCEESNCTTIPVSSNLFDNGIRDIYHDRDGSIWLATYGGIVQIKDGIEMRYSIETGMPANNFRTVFKDSKGFFWFGSRSGGLVKFKDGEIVKHYANNEGLESNFVLSVTESKHGEIYVGTHSGGLTIIDTLGVSHTYHLKADDSGVLFFNVELREDGTALIASTVGLVYFDGQQLSQIKLQKDERSRTYFDILQDDLNSIWVTSNKGVLKIKKSNLEDYLNSKVAYLSYVVFDENFGMNDEECTGATRAIKLKNGVLLIPTLGGVCRIDPSKLSTDMKMPRVKIRHVFADQVSLDLSSDERIEIESGVNRVAFQFSTLSYLSPERNLQRYKLEGFDKDWSEPSHAGEIEYTNLPPGNFVFRVMGSTDGYLWNEEGDEVSFKVLPEFYETLWFYLLLVLAAVTLFLGIYKWRMNFIHKQNIELRKVNAELDRFVYSASHEMRSPLSSILGLVQIARSDTDTDVSFYLTHIEKSVMRLDSFIKDIIDYSRNARLGIQSQTVKLHPLIGEIIEGISYTDNFALIRCEIDVPEDLALNTDMGRLKIVLSNLITNAFKHHAPTDVEDPFVQITMFKTERGVSIRIADNGPGIDKKYQRDIYKMFYRATTKTEGSGLGLYMVDEIVTKLYGQLKLDSEPEHGSIFTVHLPDLPVPKF
ncbi:ATP-binding protein [Reichenbachiella agarivorans]|uniref:histidine kinase n=1 Tax=Reichenbachiella agarivorans TaxID=2979464 RepID=A0ABY6CLS5_9BACT|nr:sensor histidine kinase [Reichenbachiella agarivorans]UXP31461.1 ATP-binding protein [Reichenbachiella agarivorans]